MTGSATLLLAVFAAVSSLIGVVALLAGGRRGRVEARVASHASVSPRAFGEAELSRSGASLLPKLGKVLAPSNETRYQRMKVRLLQAGFYQRHATGFYFGVKLLVIGAPLCAGMVLYVAQMISLNDAVLYGTVTALAGTLIPSFWLARKKAGRQKQIRRSIPDALDVIVVCLEGGLSLPAAFNRVASELHDAHPLLADEMGIVRKEMQLGRSTGEALRAFADRFDAGELRSMASVVTQAERFGASVVQALRVHADSLRLKRHQHAEAMAQKAPLKLIFPTVLCIFPALYIVLMGVALVQMYEMLESMK